MKRGKIVRSITTGVACLFLLTLNLVAFSATADAGSFPGLNGRIMMTDITGPAYHFSSIKPDGTDYKSVLADSTSKLDVAYSPNGTKIAYVQSVSSIQQVFVANANGSNPQQITSSATHIYSPSWSPDGTKILFSKAVSSHVNIFYMNADGTNETQVTSTGIYYEPEYSPDGTKIVAEFDSTDDEIYIMNTDGTNIVNLTNNSVDDKKASWSPNGTKLAYSSLVSGSQEIFTMNPDGTSKTQLTSVGDGYREPEWSPDGTKIAFIDTLAPSQTYVMNADGTNKITIAAGWPREISWQPLTLAPTSSTSTPSMTLTNGKGTLDVASMYTDQYGDGINKASVAITSAPTQGTAKVDPVTGVITYTQNDVAVGSSLLDTLASLFFPKVSAATTDSFGYQVCSSLNSGLCSTGTASVLGLSTLTNTGDSTELTSTLAIGLMSGAVWVFLRGSRRNQQNNSTV